MVGDMAYERQGGRTLNYFPCRYGASRLRFRGPKRPTNGCYLAFVGADKTYGKFVEHPFSDLVESKLGITALNLGWMNAGVDVYLNDAPVLELCTRARATVLQVMGAHNMSNRFYTVHPRRNDRFLQASALLQNIYRDVDFTEFSFTRHMLGALHAVSAERFAAITDELAAAWSARMKLLIERIAGPVVLLWVTLPGQAAAGGRELGADPLFVGPEMVAQLRPFVERIVHVTPSAAALATRRAGMVFSPLEAAAAAVALNPAVHAEIAAALVPALGEFCAG